MSKAIKILSKKIGITLISEYNFRISISSTFIYVHTYISDKLSMGVV